MTRSTPVTVRNAVGAVTLVAMVATPFGGRPTRRKLAGLVVGGMATTTVATAAERWGVARATAAAGAVTAITGLVEGVGVRTGIPFGRYRYTGVLRPEIGGVPLLVPLAWFAMAVPARDTALATLDERASRASRPAPANRWARIVAGAAALTAWDLFLDPQMVGEGYWAWARRGRYRGIPLTNYAGWFATGLAVMAVLEAILPVRIDDRGDGTDEVSSDLVVEYATMAVMETIAFAVFFRDRRVAAAGGAAMLPFAVAGLGHIARRTRGHR